MLVFMIPAFDSHGNLPPGLHSATWIEFADAFGFNAHRRMLANGLNHAIPILSSVGCFAIYIDGSFVTEKPLPQDFDVIWETEGVDLQLLRALEPLFFVFENKRAAQKTKYGGEFFPSGIGAGPSGKTFLEFFQMDRMGRPKGLICIDIKEMRV